MQDIYTLNTYRWAGHKKTVLCCPVCGKEFETFPSAVKRGAKFCSMVCRNTVRKGATAGEKHYAWNGGKIERICEVCGDKFSVKREQIRRTGAKFCSLNCRSIFNVRHNHGKNSTDIENKIEVLLQKIGVSYEKQVALHGIALVDFLLPNQKIIQCDGDYWHSLPLTKERDCRQDAQLKMRGYEILRLLGSEIKHNIDDCEREILRILTVENRADGVGRQGIR